MTFGNVPDLIRLIIVPVIGWAAWRDARTRRVPNVVWPPVIVVGTLLLGWELFQTVPPTTPSEELFLLRVTLSVGFIIPLAWLFWRLQGFGGADAKAVMTVAVLLPAYPTYVLPWATVPMERTRVGVFSLTVLTNAVLVGLVYPAAIAVRNAVEGDVSPVMALAKRLPVGRLEDHHGRLFETTEGFSRRGLDLDALRMYLRWRGIDLAELRSDPELYRDPASVGETNPVGDGAIHREPATDGGEESVGRDAGSARTAARGHEDAASGADDRGSAAEPTADDGAAGDDPWGAERFLSEIEGSAYGTTPETLREGLETTVQRDEIWISPGIPFLVPTFGGLAVALTYGDILFGLLKLVGAVP